MFERRREFIVEEQDVMIVLTGINDQTKHGFLSNITVANCGWADESSKWFIMFHADDKLYGKIVKRLNEVGALVLDTRPGGLVDVVFKRGA